MIALGETDPTAAEVPFELPLEANPLNGLTGHVFAPGEAMMKLPGSGVWIDARTQIVEKGYGRYAIQLTAAQCELAGAVLYDVVVAIAEPDRGFEMIGTLGGDIAIGADGFVWFYLANSADPINGAPVTGHVFAGGEVRVCLPAGVYHDATVANIIEGGNGLYALRLDSTIGETGRRGKVYLYASVAGAQRFEGYSTILGAAAPAVTPPGPPPIPLVPVGTLAKAYPAIDHVQAALDMLPQQFRGDP